MTTLELMDTTTITDADLFTTAADTIAHVGTTTLQDLSKTSTEDAAHGAETTEETTEPTTTTAGVNHADTTQQSATGSNRSLFCRNVYFEIVA
jgi:hypothetical protein